MKIVGAGLTGLIAGNYFAAESPEIIEAKPTLPDNHHAVLRFRTEAISNITGVPFKKVTVRKELVHEGIYVDRPNIYVSNRYSLKSNGSIEDRSVWNLAAGDRYIAPPDFVKRIAEKQKNISLGTEFDPMMADGTPVISTIPMPALMKIMPWSKPTKFEHTQIWVATATILSPDINVYQTVYCSDDIEYWYRSSVTGNKLIVEFIAEPVSSDLPEIMEGICDYFGIPTEDLDLDDLNVHFQPYGKILPIDEDLRQEFIYTMTREHNIYSLGRYATWRPVLLDDLARDLMLIRGMINSEAGRRHYRQNMHKVRAS